jgi:catalase
MKAALTEEGAMLKLVAPMVGGIEASDGTWIEADEKVDGGPSVLSDAVVLLPSQEGADLLAREPTARDFVADAVAHLKFIGYVDQVLPLLEKAGVFEDLDEGCLPLESIDDANNFVADSRKIRFWQRETRVKQV